MNLHKVKIVVPHNPNATYVELDGKRLEGVVSVKFSLDADRLTVGQLEIVMYTDEITIEGELEKRTEFYGTGGRRP